jgi:hypothetical protein
MRKFILATLAALPLALATAPLAEARGFRCYNIPFCFPRLCPSDGGAGGGGGGHGCCGSGGIQLAPWYLYWPMEAHFQVAAPTGYPYWPAAMTPPSTWGYTPQPPAHGYQPVGYGGAPSYWYNH